MPVTGPKPRAPTPPSDGGTPHPRGPCGPAATAQPSAQRTGPRPAGVPAIGIEARRAETRLAGARCEAREPGPEGHRHLRKWNGEAAVGSRPKLHVGADVDKPQRIGHAAVRAALHELELAPELRRARDRPHAPATPPPRPSVVPVELGDRLGRGGELDDLAELPRSPPRWSASSPSLLVRATSGGRPFGHSTPGPGATQRPAGLSLVAFGVAGLHALNS